MKKIWTSLSMITVMAAPIAAVVSCGSSDRKTAVNKGGNTTTAHVDNVNTPATPSNGGDSHETPENPEVPGNAEIPVDTGPDFSSIFTNPITSGGAENGAHASVNANILEGTIEENANNIEPWYGKSRPDDNTKGTNEGIEITKRRMNGHPKTPGINVADLWNWTSEATPDGLANTTQLGPDGRVKLDYIGHGTGEHPEIDFMGGMPDLEFNKATIREVQPRMFGEQLKPSQSTFARVTNMNSYTPKNGDTDFGFNKGMNTSELNPLASSEYVDLDIPWNPGPHFDAKMPSGERIDALHRHGVPTVGSVLFFPRPSGEGERNIQILTNPGPNYDYPVAKGLVEMAQTVGFDGWWFDWEIEDWNIEGFLKALNSYSHYGYYVTSEGKMVNIASKNDGTPVDHAPAADGSDLKEHYKNAKGQFRKLLVSNYWLPRRTFGYSDVYTWQQMHANDANVQNIKEHWEFAQTKNRDRYFMNGASNAPEDSISGCRKILGKYYWAARDAHPTNTPEGAAASQEVVQNQFSWWLWAYTQSSNISTQEEVWSSYAGDPRVFDGAKGHTDRFAVSNGFREHTSVLGNKDFETTFSYGNGAGFNLWGSADINKSVIGTNKNGWTNFGMTDVLPTYKWITDFYDQGENNITDLSVDETGKLAHRPVAPFINNHTKNAYYGGAALDFKGKLPVGNSMVSKLYASNIPVKQNDKFVVKVKNNWSDDADRIIPEMALWTSETQPEYEMYKEDGSLNTNAFYKSDGTEVDPLDSRYTLGWKSYNEDPTKPNEFTGRNEGISDLWRYQKDTRVGIQTKERYLKASNVEDLGNGWLNVTYDLTNFEANQHSLKGGVDSRTSLENEFILDFGLKMTGVKDAENINKLSVGELQFDAAADNTKAIKEIRNLKTKKVWNNKTLKFQKARISWETIGEDGLEYDPSEIKHYLVFYKNEKGLRTGLAWMGSNPVAYLDDISKAEKNQLVEIVAVDYNNDIVFKQDANVKLG